LKNRRDKLRQGDWLLSPVAPVNA